MHNISKNFLLGIVILILVGCSSITSVNQPEVPLMDGYSRHMLEATSANETQYTCTYQLPENYEVTIRIINPEFPWEFAQDIINDNSVIQGSWGPIYIPSTVTFVSEPENRNPTIAIPNKETPAGIITEEEKELYFFDLDSYISDMREDPNILNLEVQEVEKEKYGFSAYKLKYINHMEYGLNGEPTDLKQYTLLISNNEKNISNYFRLNITFNLDYIDEKIAENCFDSISLKIGPTDA